MTARTVRGAMTRPGVPVGMMVPVLASSVPAAFRREAERLANTGWVELYGPSALEGACRYGCKVYAQRTRTGVRYAVLHAPSYGHGRGLRWTV